jgi:hypothetical protein
MDVRRIHGLDIQPGIAKRNIYAVREKFHVLKRKLCLPFEGRILKYSLLGGGLGYVVLLLNQKLYIQFYGRFV